MLVQHVETSKPTDEKMFEELSGLNLKVGKLDEDFAMLCLGTVEQVGTDRLDVWR